MRGERHGRSFPPPNLPIVAQFTNIMQPPPVFLPVPFFSLGASFLRFLSLPLPHTLRPLLTQRAATGRSGGSGRLDGDLRALLRERPDSAVAEILFAAPSLPTGRVVGVVPVANPIVGHLAMARLAGGSVEMVNLAVVALQVGRWLLLCCVRHSRVFFGRG